MALSPSPFFPEEQGTQGSFLPGAPEPQVDLIDLLSEQATEGPTRLPYNPLTEEEALLYPNTLPVNTSLVQEVQSRLFAPIFGTPVPQIGVSAGVGAAIGAGFGGVGALPGAAIGAAIGILADVLGTTGEVKVKQILEGRGGLETPFGTISPELAGLISNIAIQIPTTGGLVKGATKGAIGLGWIKAAKGIEAQLGLPIGDVVPPNMKLKDALASVPGGPAFYEADERYRILARTWGRYGPPPDWDSMFLNRAKMSTEVRKFIDETLIPPVEEAFRAPEVEGFLKTIFPAAAAARGAGAFSDFIWQRLFSFVARPERVLYGDPAAMRGLHMLKGAEMTGKGYAEGIRKLYPQIMGDTSVDEQELLKKIWLHAQGYSGAQLKKLSRQKPGLPAEDIFVGKEGAELAQLKKYQETKSIVRKSQLPLFDDVPEMTPAISFDQEKTRVVDLLTRLGKPHLIPKYEAMSAEFQFMGKALVDLGLLNEKHLIPNYLSFVRQKLEAQGTTLIELTNGYFPASIKNIVPNKLRSYILRERKLKTPPEDTSLEEIWDTYARAFANLTTNHAVFPHLQQLTPQIADPRKATYFGNLFNYFVGNPNSGPELISRDAATIMKTVQFWRIIGGSLLTPLVNTTQRMNILGYSGYKNWMKGWLPNTHVDRRARELGLVEGNVGLASATGDIDEGIFNAIMRGPLKTFNDIVSWPFMRSEQGNRLHAFRSAFYEAMEKPGMTTGLAEEYARHVVDNTQFMTRVARTPAIMRSELGSVVGQFKVYMINQLGMMETLSRSNPKGAARVMTAALTLLGPDAILPGFDLFLSRHLLGEPKKSPFKGALGHIGASMADQAAIFGFGRDDFSRLLQYFPGPSVEHGQKMLGALLGVNLGNGGDLERFGLPMSPDERAGAIISSIPFGGIAGRQGNRLRLAAKLIQSGGEARGAQTAAEAWGLESARGPLRERVSASEAGLQVLGLRSPRMREREEIMDLMQSFKGEYNSTMARISELIATGRNDLADAEIRHFRGRYPELTYLFPTAAGIKRGTDRIISPQSWRAVQGLPAHLRLTYLHQLMQREL